MSEITAVLTRRTVPTLPDVAEVTRTARRAFRWRRAESASTAGSLAGLRVGGSGRVIGFCGLDEAAARRLIDLGFAPGARVDVLRRAPLADPLVFGVADTEIALRRRQAAGVRIAPLD